jgi:hypothetical protein
MAVAAIDEWPVIAMSWDRWIAWAIWGFALLHASSAQL